MPHELWASPAITFKGASMTAIGVSGSQQGFIIGADGRKRVDDASRAAKPELAINDSQVAQKIFPIVGQDRSIAYAIAGNVVAHAPDSPFDALKECAALVRHASDYDYENATKLVNRFSKSVAEAISEAKHFPQHNQTPDGSWKIMDLIFAGYFRGAPFLTYVSFEHSHRFAEFHSQAMSPVGILYGSEVVRKAMYDDMGDIVTNSPFSRYIQDPRKIQSLEESEKYVKGYIEACSTELALKMDESYCKKIGGHIHVAEITASGFKWRIPPIEEKTAA